MDDIAASDLKTILHSKRANIYYLEHCRVLANGGRVEYVTDAGKRSLYWNIPIANTTSILLGTGTSITQAAMRALAKAGVLVGFCGGGGTPLFSAMRGDDEQQFRRNCIEALTRSESLDFMIDTVKEIAMAASGSGVIPPSDQEGGA
jgi:CRISPR-associated endonuclease Cas1